MSGKTKHYKYCSRKYYIMAAKKYGPGNEIENIKAVKLKKNDISNETSMIDVEKRISELNDQIKITKK